MKNQMMDNQEMQATQQMQINAQKIIAQKPQQQQIIENNNNQPLIDPTQKRRLSRQQDSNVIDKNQTLPLENHSKPNETHYIKNKALQSPVNRYKVCIRTTCEALEKGANKNWILCVFSGTRRKNLKKQGTIDFIIINSFKQWIE